MSFWKTFGFHTVSAIDTLLESGEYTLDQLLDEEDILQETKSQNRKLLDFLTEPETLRKLLIYITVEPEETADEEDTKRKYKYPFLACEILGSEVWAICDSFFNQPELLEELFSFFEKDPPLNTLLAGYASRIAGALLQKKTVETVAYLKDRKDIIPTFLKHVGNGAIMDLLLKIIGSEEMAEGTGVLEWLCTTDLIPALITKFDAEESGDVHENASQALCDIIAVSSNPGSSPLIAQLESESVVNLLFSHVLGSGLHSSLFHGLAVLIELLKPHLLQQHDDLKQLSELPTFLKIVVSHLDELHNLLATADKTSETEPLGFNRLKIMEFFMVLARTNLSCIDAEMMKRNILGTCLNLFFKYEWNNFLHTIVEQMVLGVLQGENEAFKLSALHDSKLIEKICAGSDVNEAALKLAKPIRKGYMGHLTSISTNILETAKNFPELEKYLAAHPLWNNYVSGPLQRTLDLEKTIIGGFMPTGILPEDKMVLSQEEKEALQNQQNQHYRNFDVVTFPTDLTGEDDDLDDDFDGEGFGGEESFKLDEDDDDDDDDDDEEDEEGIMIQNAVVEDDDEPEEAEVVQIVSSSEEWEEKTITETESADSTSPQKTS